MEKERTYTFQGYTLHSETELLEVKKEAEAISYIKTRADLSDVKVALQVYNRLIEKGTLSTVLGVDFLKGLREQLIASGVVSESGLKPVPRAKQYAKKTEKKELTREQKLVEYYREKTKNQRIVIAALCAVIVVLFLIRLFGTSSPFRDYENEVLNEYGGWQDELVLKEQQLRIWEEELSEREKALTEQEEKSVPESEKKSEG